MKPTLPCALALSMILTLSAGRAAAAPPEMVLQIGHSDAIVDVVAYEGADRRMALTLGRDLKLKIWDADAGQLLRSVDLPGSSLPTRALPVGGGLEAIVFAKSGDPWRVGLETGSLESVKITGGYVTDPQAACVSADGRRAVLDGLLVSLPDLKVIANLEVPERRKPTACGFGRDGATLALGTMSGFVHWYDLKKGAELVDMRSWGAFEVLSVSQSPTSPDQWAVETRAQLVVWDLKARDKVMLTQNDFGGRLLWSLDGKSVAKATVKKKWGIYDLSTGKHDYTSGKGRWVGPVGEGPLLWGLEAGGLDATLEGFDPVGPVSALKGTALTASGMGFMPDGRRVAVGTRKGEVQLWDMHQGRQRPSGWEVYGRPVTAIAFSPDGAWAVTGHEDGEVVIRVGASGKIDRRKAFSGPINRLRFFDDQTLVINAGFYNDQQVLKVNLGTEGKLPEHLSRARLMDKAAKVDRVIFTEGGEELFLAEGDQIRSLGQRLKVQDLVIDPAGDGALVLEKSGQVKHLELPSGKLVGEYDTNGTQVERLSAAPTGHLFVGSGGDGTLRMWRRGSRGLELTFFADDAGEWIAWAPSGAFDASAGGGRYVAWKVGDKIAPLERLQARYRVPDLMRYRLAPEAQAVEVAPISKGWSPPPTVRIVSPASGAQIEEASVKVSIEVADGGGGIGEVRLYHEGRLVGAQGEVKGAVTFTVHLKPGDNTLWASALSAEQVEGRSAAVALTQARAAQPARLRVLSIGINKYRDESLKLRSARQDAEAMSAALIKGGGGLFPGGSDQRIVVDEGADTKGILGGFEWLIGDTRADDVAVIFIAAHGETDGDRYYLIPQEMTYSGVESVARQGISQETLRELIRRIPARRVVVLMDTCKSGQFSENFGTRGFKMKKNLSLLGQSTGMYMVAATTSQQLALEDTSLGHGLFTWAVLAALEGKADADSDKAVSIHELIRFIQDEVARVSKERFDHEQFPVTSGLGQDFPISRAAP